MRDQNPFSPCCPPPSGGYLMQQIVASGQAFLRYQRFDLPLSCLPCDARPPFSITAVRAREDGIIAQREEDPCRRGLRLKVRVPLYCTVQDACGACFTASSQIEVCVPMRVCDPRQAARPQAVAAAQARLCRPCGCAEGLPAAWLDVWVQAWLTACRPLYGEGCAAPCPPPLPLYPPPCHPGR